MHRLDVAEKKTLWIAFGPEIYIIHSDYLALAYDDVIPVAAFLFESQSSVHSTQLAFTPIHFARFRCRFLRIAFRFII